MHWENTSPQWSDLPDSEIPPELLDGLERLSQGARFLKVRFRWRPHETVATGFLTKDRLLNLGGQPVIEVARALASHATHLHDGGGCEGKFEAQVHRELEDPGEDDAKREWRSITFYVADAAPSRPTSSMGYDDSNDFGARHHQVGWGATRTAVPAAPAAPAGYDDYANFVELSRTDPTAFAMLVIQQSNDRLVNTLERLLASSTGRLDGVLAQQGSSSRYLNEAFQTLTKGAGSIAGLGVQLFNQGLESQARVARMEHDTELGKERTELMRDAVKQGSLLMQAVLMANTAKRQHKSDSSQEPSSTRRRRRKRRRRAAESAEPSASTSAPMSPDSASPTPSGSVSAPTPSEPANTTAPSSESVDERSTFAEPEPVPTSAEERAVTRIELADEGPPDSLADDDDAEKSEADLDIEARAERLFELLDDELLEQLEEVAPSLRAVFDELDEDQLEADAIREIIVRSQTTVDGAELVKARELFDGELSNVFAGLVVRVLTESMG